MIVVEPSSCNEMCLFFRLHWSVKIPTYTYYVSLKSLETPLGESISMLFRYAYRGSCVLPGQVTTNYAASVLRALGRHNSVPSPAFFLFATASSRVEGGDHR